MSEKHTNILVIKLGALGDFIQAMGLFKAIRAHHEHQNKDHDVKITLLTTAPFKGLAEKSGYFDHIILDPRAKWYKPHKLLSLRANILNMGFERIYDLQNNDRTSLYFTLLSPNKHQIEWVGVDPRASHSDRRSMDIRRSMHAFETLAQTVQCGGVQNIEIDSLEWMRGQPYQEFDLKKPYILIVPGCAPTRPEKRWVSERYADITERLEGKGYHCVLLGTDAEQEITNKIQELSTAKNLVNLTGKTSLNDLASLGRDASFAIGNDTGPMHIIGPSGCPCLVLYPESSNPVRYSPLGKIVKTIQKPEMQDISADEVWDQVLAMETEINQ